MARPLILAGQPHPGSRVLPIYSPWNGAIVAEVSEAGPAELEIAAAAAARDMAITSKMSAYQRYEILRRIAAGVRNRGEELAQSICQEAGKPIALARLEVSRATDTLELSAEEARRLGGEVVPIDGVASGAGRIAFTRRVPRGPVLAISPFNFPLNLVCHKVGPAIAVGAPVVLKPAEQTPTCALILGEIVLEAGWQAISVLPADRRIAPQLVQDTRFRVVSFTGSDRVGWAIRAAAAHAQVVLELGGNAAVILEPDANLDTALPAIARAANTYAGQVCISVQHILAHQAIAAEVKARLADEFRKVPTGSPQDPQVLCGPVVNTQNCERLQSWMQEAEAGGAERLAGGEVSGNLLAPSLLTGVPEDARLRVEEAFGPVAHIDSYTDIHAAIAQLNHGRYGLQTGLYTQDIRTVLNVFSNLEVGGLIHNDVPAYRADPMPYGGNKASGFGREGPRYAVEEMTEPRLLVLRGD